MFPNAAPTGTGRTPLPPASPVSNWSVFLYRKPESSSSSFQSYESSQGNSSQQAGASFYIQLQFQADSKSPARSDVLCLRYQFQQQQRNNLNSYTLPFTISQLSDMNLSPDTASLPATGPSSSSSRFYNAEQQTVRKS